LTFRPASLDDLEDVLAVVARTDEQAGLAAPPPESEGDRGRVTELLAAPDHFNEVAEADGRVIGYVNLHDRDGAAHLAYLFVDPEHQGKGIGTALMARALDHARRRGYTRATLGTAVENAAARRFYERGGWKDTGHRTQHRRLQLEMADYALDLDRHE
jgi:ribosomal protein S18 acetylase RimI-like enzyme